VTQADLSGWKTLCKGLAASLTSRLTDETIGAQFYALIDLSLPDLERAAKRLEQTEHAWPRPADWRRAVGETRSYRTGAPDLRSVPDPCCEDCQDTGFITPPRQCPGVGAAAATEHGPDFWPCQRGQVHAPHTWTDVCPCRASNPRYQATHRPRPQDSHP
jgi:hypothetical protein